MNYAAFFSYIFLTAFSPGPNNIMSMANASKHGFVKGLPFIIGILIGTFIVVGLGAAFTSLLVDLIPKIEPFLLCGSAAYILWLAWSVWRDKPKSKGKHSLETNSIPSGMILQFINVKLVFYGLSSLSAFVLPFYKGFPELFPFVILITLVGFASVCSWSVFGVVFESLFTKHKKITNAILALALVYCAASQLISMFSGLLTT